MDNLEIKHGYTRVANEILDNIVKVNLSAYESRVLWAIIRLTYGWNKKSARISLGRLAMATNLPRKKIHSILKKLEFKLFIIIDRKKKGYIITFQKDFDLWYKAIQINYTKSELAILSMQCCVVCKQIEKLHEHHILPKEWGGSEAKQNKVYLCRLCHYRVHLWIKYTHFTNGQDLYDKFWEELRCPLFKGPFDLDLSPEQVAQLSPIEVKNISPTGGTIKYIKKRKETLLQNAKFKKMQREQPFWPQCQNCGSCYDPNNKSCPYCKKPKSKSEQNKRRQLLLNQIESMVKK